MFSETFFFFFMQMLRLPSILAFGKLWELLNVLWTFGNALNDSPTKSFQKQSSMKNVSIKSRVGNFGAASNSKLA